MYPAETREPRNQIRKNPVKVFTEERRRSMLEQLMGSECSLKSTFGFAHCH